MGLLKKMNDADPPSTSDQYPAVSTKSSSTPSSSSTLSSAPAQDHSPRRSASVTNRIRKPLPALKPPQSPRSAKLSSMFGRQVLSQKTSGPRILFGTSDRATSEKQYYSQELDKCRIGLDGPGPVYEVKVTSIGKQVASRKESAPEVAFGMSRRFSTRRYGDGNPGPGAYASPSAFGPQVLSYQKSPWFADFSRSTREEQNKIYMSAEFDKSKYGVGSPGPTVCDDTSSMGNQVVASFKSAPRACFGAEKRFKHPFMNDNASSPGVGKYEFVSCFGKQNESKRKNLPAFTFSQSNRDQRAKVFISAQHDKAHYGEASPGPAAILKAFPSLGEMQVDSRKASCSASRFGRATRFKDYYSDNPGPGNYNC